MRTILIVAAGAALLVPAMGLGIFAHDSGAQIVGRMPSVVVIQGCKQGAGAYLSVGWYAEEPWDEAYVDTTFGNDWFERGIFGGSPGGGPQPSSDASFPGYYGSATIDAHEGWLTYLRVNLRYASDWYPSTVVSFMVQNCSAGTAVLPAAPSGTGNEGTISGLDSRLRRLETATFGYFGVPVLGASLKDRIDPLVSCVNSVIRALGSPYPTTLFYCQ